MNAQASSAERPFRPFTRVLATPPGWPWDQTRAAMLEARHTSPVASDGVNIIVRRIKAWALGEGGEFVAIYLRVGDPFPAQGLDVDVRGRTIHIDLPSRAARAEQLKDQVTRIAAVSVMVVVVLGLVTLAFERRAALDDHLGDAEVRVAHEAREAHAVARAKHDAEALTELDVTDGLDKAINDLTYVTAAKDSTARLDAFYWSKGFWAVEAHGNDAPIKDPGVTLQKSTTPVRPGVWLWAAPDPSSSREIPR
jgi:hypothetical protein